MEGYVEVCGEQFKVVKTGRAQAEQVVLLGRWLSTYGAKVVTKALPEDGDIEKAGVGSIVSNIIENLSADALLDLFVVVIGCSPEQAEECFDIAVLIDAAMEVYEKSPAVKRLIQRFFSPQPSTPSTEESSTTSEEPTAG